MDMAAEYRAGLRGTKGYGCIFSVTDVIPAGGMLGAGVNVKSICFSNFQGQACKEGFLRGGKLGLCPEDGGMGCRVHGGGGLVDGAVMVAHNAERAFVHQISHLIDHKAWVCAIAYQIAQKHEARGCMLAGVVEAGGEGLSVGVNIGKKG